MLYTRDEKTFVILYDFNFKRAKTLFIHLFVLSSLPSNKNMMSVASRKFMKYFARFERAKLDITKTIKEKST